MRRYRALWITLLALSVVALTAVPVVGAPPLRLDAGLVTDDANVLGSQTADVEAALEQLNDEHGVQVFVAYVNSFDGMPSQQWADETAQINGLGLNDVLLAVAVVDRQYAWSVDQDFPLSDAQLDDVAAEYIEPALQDDDWAGAAIAAAEGYSEALAPDQAPPPGGSGTESDSGGTPISACLLPLAIIAIVIGVAVIFLSRRRGQKAPAASSGETPAAAPQLDMKSLEIRAGKLLVEVDDAMRSSEEELGFAEAEFGEEAVREYREALAESRNEITEAFRLQQKVFDSEPEDEATRRQMLEQIAALAEKADARLDEKAESFAELRDLAKRVDEVVANVTQRIDAAERGLPVARETLAELKQAYVATALGEVIDDDAEAEASLGIARTAVSEASAASAAGDDNEAAISAREAEEAVAQAERLLAAVSAMKSALEQAKTDLGGEISRLEQAVDAAESQGATDLAARAQAGREVADAAQAALEQSQIDPMAHLDAVRAAASELETALGTARDAARAASASIATARERIASAEAYVQTRRAAVGPQARSSLTEAKRRLVQAEQLLASDPAGAETEAQAAQQYADSASRYAQGDVATFERSRPAPPSSGGTIAAAVGGAVLASLARGALGGGRSSGGFGGFSPGFGGSSRRSGGSRIGSSGGRRGGGGRF
jgi:uncharacterized membrane protein YgcG